MVLGILHAGSTEFDAESFLSKGVLHIHLWDRKKGMSITNNCEACFEQALTCLGYRLPLPADLKTYFSYNDTYHTYTVVTFDTQGDRLQDCRWVRVSKQGL